MADANITQWLRIRDVTAELKVSETTVRAWLVSGKLEAFKIDGVVRVDRRSIDRLGQNYPYRAPVRPSARPWWRRSPHSRAS